ncbi:SGNH/GDSL hydrolase family protein [Nibricoccus sp. IMCC34717]|uniref:SGNH/GDSL hydrolase family protein n=1 Tax=Nibricoccus sp. IMCC34717 TaxID=3034021 RepID=UPI00385061A3
MPPFRPLLLWLLIGAFAGKPIAHAAPQAFESEVAALEQHLAAHPQKTGAIVFAGSSSIRLWKTLATDFPSLRCINVGFGGAKVDEVEFFAPRLILPLRPRQIVFYAGTNDIADGRSPEVAFQEFKSFVGTVRDSLPEVHLSFISCAPNPARWHLIEQIRRYNALVAAWIATQPRMDYIDVYAAMLGDDGQPRPELFIEDKLHMNENGYALWRELVGPFLIPEP